MNAMHVVLLIAGILLALVGAGQAAERAWPRSLVSLACAVLLVGVAVGWWG